MRKARGDPQEIPYARNMRGQTMKIRLLYTAILALCCLAGARPGVAAEYHVGPGQPYGTMSDLLASVTLGDNDIAWVHPGTYGPFSVTSGGGSSADSPAQIRAWDMNDKPVFDGGGVDNCIQIEAGPEKWWKLVGIEQTNSNYRGIYHLCGGLILQDCYVHDNAKNGVFTSMCGTRDAAHARLIVEGCELARNGSGGYYHSWYLQEYHVEARYNWTHDLNGGIGYKDRSRESLLEYNLIESGPGGAGCAVSFCGWDDTGMPDVPAVATMVGNVVTKNGGGNRWLFIDNIRNADGGTTGYTSPGYLYLYNNTFYTENHTGPMLADDERSIIVAHNNIFHSATCDRIWDQVVDAAGPGQILTSYNNWVTDTMALPAAFTDTVTGSDPGWVYTAWSGGDFHLTAGSPCIDGGRNDVAVLPTREYAPPCGGTDRPNDGEIDIGAYEYAVGVSGLHADFSASPTSGAPPLTVSFSDLSNGAPTSWSWDFGDGGASSTQNPTHEYTLMGIFDVSLTAENAGGSDTETKPGYIAAGFPDVPPDYWAYDSVRACYNDGIAAGYPEGVYHPDWSVSRDQMAVFVSRALAGGDEHIPTGPAVATFSDVPTDHWAFKWIEYAHANGIVAGYDDGTYRPTLEVDRGQMAVFIARAIATPSDGADLEYYTPPGTPTFPDVPADFWAYKYVEYIAAAGVTTGYDDGTYRPDVVVTRDQMAVYIQRAFNLPG